MPVTTPRVRILLLLAIAVLGAATVHRLWWATPPSTVHEFRGPTMGTTYRVKLRAALRRAERASIAAELSERLDRIEQLMSTYRPDSELSRFNRHQGPDPFPVSSETLRVFQIAREISELSGGAFDVTVAAIVNAWGFGATDRPPGTPEPQELARLLQHVGYRLISVDASARALSKADPSVRCDLSAIAKGFAVDELGTLLEKLGYGDFLIEIGGELKGSGRRADGQPWRVGVEQPDAENRLARRVVPLDNQAIATSGDYRDWYEERGQRISHTIDPRTGTPIRHGLASVSVVHPTAAHADALATALNVLGPREGYALAESAGIAAYFVRRVGEGEFEAFATPAFEALQAEAANAAPKP